MAGDAGWPAESGAEGQTRRESYSQGLSQCLQTGILHGLCPCAALPVRMHLLSLLMFVGFLYLQCNMACIAVILITSISTLSCRECEALLAFWLLMI